MKIPIFCILLLAGAVFSEDCIRIAKENCPKAFENYTPGLRLKYCSHVTKVENCLKGVHERCYTHFYHTYEDICGSHDIMN